jgi:hypothetical protein
VDDLAVDEVRLSIGSVVGRRVSWGDRRDASKGAGGTE